MSLQNGKKPAMVVNISAYRFVFLDDLVQIQERLRSLLATNSLKGTILLSTEGINLNLAGEAAGIEAFCSYLDRDSRFAGMVYKRSESESVPFKRALVKIKPEIITFRMPNIHPEVETVPHVSPKALATWLSEQKDLVLIDTRNAFEVAVGTFVDAKHADIEHFTEFATAIAAKTTEEEKKKPTVIFCTGGVRCEKAGPALVELGFTEVYQLDGGILAYFEQCGGEHYTGDCFVFDDRFALTPTLQPTRNSA